MKKPDGIHMLITHPQLKGGEPGEVYPVNVVYNEALTLLITFFV